MAKSPIFHGAKAKVHLDGKLIGSFTSATWSSSNDLHVAHVLGRHSPAAFTYTGAEAVRVTLTGFRIIDSGPFALGTVPQLKQLMQYPGLQLEIVNRETDETITRVSDCFATDFSTGVNARAVSDVTVTMLGRVISDETTDGAEAAGDVKIDDGTPNG